MTEQDAAPQAEGDAGEWERIRERLAARHGAEVGGRAFRIAVEVLRWRNALDGIAEA